MLETAFILPVFISVIVGIFEFSRAVYAYNFVSFAAREGSTYAMRHGSSSGAVATAADIRAVALRHAVALDANNFTVTTTWLPDNKPGSKVRVLVQYNCDPIVRLVIQDRLRFASQSEIKISE